jgi:hypothetical protein
MMNQTPSRLSLRPATTALSHQKNTLLRIGLGGALLALTAACSGDIDPGSEDFEGELDTQDTAVVDAFEGSDSWGSEQEGAIEKATFDDNRTFNGFNVACTAAQKQRIRDAEARARQILEIAGPANAAARVNRTTSKAGTFRTYFVPNGNTNPDPNRTSPDAWDTASFRVAQKLVKVSEVLASAVHTCHGGNESVIRRGDGTFRTCNESLASAATEFVGGADNAVRWCDIGLEQDLNARAATLLHELTHQDRTVDATGIPAGRVFDNNNTGNVYNAHNYSVWFLNNTP